MPKLYPNIYLKALANVNWQKNTMKRSKNIQKNRSKKLTTFHYTDRKFVTETLIATWLADWQTQISEKNRTKKKKKIKLKALLSICSESKNGKEKSFLNMSV